MSLPLSDAFGVIRIDAQNPRTQVRSGRAHLVSCDISRGASNTVGILQRRILDFETRRGWTRRGDVPVPYGAAEHSLILRATTLSCTAPLRNPGVQRPARMHSLEEIMFLLRAQTGCGATDHGNRILEIAGV